MEIVVSDGNSQYSQMIDVVVTSKPDLVVETISVSNPDTGGSGLRDGEVGTILSYVRNEGMGDAGGVEVRCYLDDALVGTSTIPLVTPGGLEEVQCDAVFQGPGIQLVRVEVDNSGSILETDEGNNVKELEVTVGTNSQSPSEEDESNRNAIILAGSHWSDDDLSGIPSSGAGKSEKAIQQKSEVVFLTTPLADNHIFPSNCYRGHESDCASRLWRQLNDEADNQVRNRRVGL